jgi:hypothetical protein
LELLARQRGDHEKGFSILQPISGRVPNRIRAPGASDGEPDKRVQRRRIQRPERIHAPPNARASTNRWRLVLKHGVPVSGAVGTVADRGTGRMSRDAPKGPTRAWTRVRARRSGHTRARAHDETVRRDRSRARREHSGSHPRPAPHGQASLTRAAQGRRASDGDRSGGQPEHRRASVPEDSRSRLRAPRHRAKGRKTSAQPRSRSLCVMPSIAAWTDWRRTLSRSPANCRRRVET